VAASAGDIIRMLNDAERNLPAVHAIGSAAAAMLATAAGTVRSAGAGVPDQALASNIDAAQRQFLAAFNAVSAVGPVIRREITEIQATFGRRH
jgi:hypothetical protein